MDRLCAIRGLSTESICARTIVKGVWQTLQRTPLRQWLSLEPPRYYGGSDGANLDSTGVAGHQKRRSLGFERQKAGLPGK